MKALLVFDLCRFAGTAHSCMLLLDASRDRVGLPADSRGTSGGEEQERSLQICFAIDHVNASGRT
eukprot:1894071-Pleurochrysis_carterae.AAC.1